MGNFEEIIDVLKGKLIDLSELTVMQYKDEAVADGVLFLETSKEKLKRWTGLLVEGQLTVADFEWLVQSQMDLLQLQALKQAGLAQIRVDHFRFSVMNLIVDTILGAVLPG